MTKSKRPMANPSRFDSEDGHGKYTDGFSEWVSHIPVYPVTQGMVDKIMKLTEGVEINIDEDLPNEENTNSAACGELTFPYWVYS